MKCISAISSGRSVHACLHEAPSRGAATVGNFVDLKKIAVPSRQPSHPLSARLSPSFYLPFFIPTAPRQQVRGLQQPRMRTVRATTARKVVNQVRLSNPHCSTINSLLRILQSSIQARHFCFASKSKVIDDWARPPHSSPGIESTLIRL